MPAVRCSNALKLFWRLHRWLYQASNGQLGTRIQSDPVLLLTTTGRKSGQERINTLYYLTDEGRFIVIVSNAGHTKHRS